MPYKPIENYGIIGNIHTAAMVGMDGSIDWLCFPHSDCPCILRQYWTTKKVGASKSARLVSGPRTKQFYWPNSNVLITRFFAAEGNAQVRIACLRGFLNTSLGTAESGSSDIRGNLSFDRNVMLQPCEPSGLSRR